MKRNPVRQVLFPIITAFIWGTTFVAQDVCADRIDAFTFNALRSYVAVAVLLLIIFIFNRVKNDTAPAPTTQEKKHDRRQLWLGGFCCGTALAVASALQQAGLSAGTDAGKAGFITALYVVLVPLFGLFFHRKVSLPVWIAVMLSVAALYLLCISGELHLTVGDLLILACAFCFAGHILIVDHFTATVEGMRLSCVQFLFCALWSTLASLVFSQPDWHAILQLSIPILYAGVFSSGVAYTLQILAQKDSNPTVVTILLSLESVFAVIAGAIILHQSMSGREYLGCILMFAAVLLAQIEFPVRKKVSDT